MIDPIKQHGYMIIGPHTGNPLDSAWAQLVVTQQNLGCVWCENSYGSPRRWGQPGDRWGQQWQSVHRQIEPHPPCLGHELQQNPARDIHALKLHPCQTHWKLSDVCNGLFIFYASISKQYWRKRGNTEAQKSLTNNCLCSLFRIQSKKKERSHCLHDSV